MSEAFTGSIIQLTNNVSKALAIDATKVCPLGEELSEQAIDILIASPLPGCIRRVITESGV